METQRPFNQPPHESSPEDLVRKQLDNGLLEQNSPELPKGGRIKKSSTSFIIRTILLLFFVTIIVLIRRMDQMSYESISEEEAMELAQEVKISIPDQEMQLLDSQETKKLKVGTTVKVLGVYKEKLSKGNSPRVYWTNQYYLIELSDSTRGVLPLMETAIGQRTVLPEGDTAVITDVKKTKKAPTIQATGETSRFDYAYTLEGHKEQYALEDLHINFPFRVAYLGNGLREEDYTAAADSTTNELSFFGKVKKFFLYDIRPVTKKQGFFLFPKHQSWNEFLLKRWFRVILIILAYILEIILIFRILRNSFSIIRRIKGIIRFNKNYRNAKHNDGRACFEVAEACRMGSDEDGVREPNFYAAMYWYKKAAENGRSEACAKLGEIYENGRGSIKANPLEAYRWYKAGMYSNEQCEKNVTRIIKNNVGALYYANAVEANKAKDYDKAIQMLKIAVDRNYDKAQYLLGFYYENGIGSITKNLSEAAKWYRKAAEQGYAEAQFRLGGMYSMGMGVPEDQNESLNWIKKAADRGYQPAIDILKNSNML